MPTPLNRRPGRLRGIAWVLLSASLVLEGCSVRKFAVNKLGNALAESGATFTSDDDPELVEAALPFSLKLMETLLAESPRHRGLLTAAARGFAQYSFAFVQMKGDRLEDRDLDEATRIWHRATKLYLRARDYGLRGLEVAHEGVGAELRRHPERAVARADVGDVPLLYWTAASWAGAIALSKDDPDAVGDVPIVEALVDRALELDESFSDGAIHVFLISYEMSRPGGAAEALTRARGHFERAMELTDGQLASPLVVLAESVALAEQDRTEFERLLRRALAIDPDARPEWRLPNLVYQRRARWLLDREDRLILD